MKNRTKKEIEEFTATLWPKLDVRFSVSADCVEIRVEDRGLHFSDLCALSEFFGTRNIDEASYGGGAGCPTCGYGSETGIELTVRPDST